MREAVGTGPGGGGGYPPLFVDMSVALAVYEVPVFDALDGHSFLPSPVADLAFRETTTGFGPLENGTQRVGHVTELALWGVEGFGGGREPRPAELAPALVLTVIFSGGRTDRLSQRHEAE